MNQPRISLYQRQERHPCQFVPLQLALEAALPRVLQVARSESAPLRFLEEVEATVVSDETIAQIHAEFLQDPTPTDVITFHHGEILVSADTAARSAPKHGLAFQEELCLYLIHGLLHLAGWDDHEPDEAAEMKTHQEAILANVQHLLRSGS